MQFAVEQTLVSICINALIPTGVIAALSVAPPDGILGPHPLLPGLVLASGLATTLMTLGLTIGVRQAVRRGRVAPLDATGLGPVSRRLPADLPARALLMGLLAIAVFVPTALLAAIGLKLLPLSSIGFVCWNLGYGAAVGLVMTPAVVSRALADG